MAGGSSHVAALPQNPDRDRRQRRFWLSPRRIAQPFPENVKTLPFGDPPVYRAIGLSERTANPKARALPRKTARRNVLRSPFWEH